MTGLRLARKAKGLTQQHVADELHISREALSYYENGLRDPGVAMLVKMSRYFGVSVDELIGIK